MAKTKQIAALLKADLSASSDLAQIAKMLEKKGRGNDTILAHITQREAQILKDMGGAGTVNPDTGLLEFYDGDFGDFAGEIMMPPEVAPAAPVTPAAAPISYGFPDVLEEPATPAQGLQATPGAGMQLAAPVGLPAFQPTGAVGPSITPQQVAAFGPQVTIPETRMGYGLADRAVTPFAGETAPPPQEKSFFQKLAGGLTTQDMVRLGLAGGLGVLGTQQARTGARQAQTAAREQAGIGRPYQEQGQALVGAAMRGELTPVGQQSLQALQARLAQGVEQRGGVGAAQAAAQVEAFRQQLLQGQYDYGLKVTNIGDQIALGAIRTGMQADQALQTASSNFYTNLAAIAGGLPMRAGS